MKEPREIHVVVVERSAEDRQDDRRHNEVIRGYYRDAEEGRNRQADADREASRFSDQGD